MSDKPYYSDPMRRLTFTSMAGQKWSRMGPNPAYPVLLEIQLNEHDMATLLHRIGEALVDGSKSIKLVLPGDFTEEVLLVADHGGQWIPTDPATGEEIKRKRGRRKKEQT